MPKTVAPAFENKPGAGDDNRSANADEAALDRDELLARCMGNAALAQRLIGSFINRATEELVELEQLLSAGQVEPFARKAHQLQGSAANISAGNLRRLFSALERLGNEGRITEMKSYLSDVRRELDRFADYCANLQWDTADSASANQ